MCIRDRVETTQQSNKNGIALFSVDNKKSYDGIWYYAEVSAPEGYVLDRTEYEINDKDFSDSLSTAVKYADTVRNYRCLLYTSTRSRSRQRPPRS